MKRTLLIISHTEHFRDGDNKIVGWASTVREIDEFTKHFDSVIHAACLHTGDAPTGLAAYSNSNVRFVALPPFGGAGFKKISVIVTAPIIIWRVFSMLKLATHFQFRAPTSMGIYLIPLLTWFSKKKGWFKYAGNWAEANPPMSYSFQRRFLSHYQKRPVTINGKWHDQPEHCFTFENPCLDEHNLIEGKHSCDRKRYEPPYSLCFSGRLERAKGVKRILEALSEITDKNLIKVVHFVGDGNERSYFEKLTKGVSVQCIFHGFLSREQLFTILKESDFFTLPSTASEGFPKVIAEAANFGCVPIVSNISSIPQYINESNGFVWDVNTDFSAFLKQALLASNDELKKKTEHAFKVASLFTYSRYVDRIEAEILKF